jgi:hypothetical protein
MDGPARAQRAQRFAHRIAPAQLPLALEPAANSSGESALRAAYRRLPIAHRLSYEQAMSRAAYAIGIRNLAEALARRGERRQRV